MLKISGSSIEQPADNTGAQAWDNGQTAYYHELPVVKLSDGGQTQLAMSTPPPKRTEVPLVELNTNNPMLCEYIVVYI